MALEQDQVGQELGINTQEHLEGIDITPEPFKVIEVIDTTPLNTIDLSNIGGTPLKLSEDEIKIIQMQRDLEELKKRSRDGFNEVVVATEKIKAARIEDEVKETTTVKTTTTYSAGATSSSDTGLSGLEMVGAVLGGIAIGYGVVKTIDYFAGTDIDFVDSVSGVAGFTGEVLGDVAATMDDIIY